VHLLYLFNIKSFAGDGTGTQICPHRKIC